MRRAAFAAKSAVMMRSDRRALRDMVHAERLPARELAELTDRRTTELVLHAYRTVPYYRDRFTAAGFSETDLRQAKNFVHLPVLTKADILDAGTDMVSCSAPVRDRLPSLTGGSTGAPLRVENDARAPVAALWWRIYGWWGVYPWDNAAFIYRQSRSGMAAVKYAAQWWPTRHALLDARGTTESDSAQFLRRIQRQRPALLVGYVEALADFARFVRSTSRS
ncbi:hypothetical protein [Microbacterium lacticum]